MTHVTHLQVMLSETIILDIGLLIANMARDLEKLHQRGLLCVFSESAPGHSDCNEKIQAMSQPSDSKKEQFTCDVNGRLKVWDCDY